METLTLFPPDLFADTVYASPPREEAATAAKPKPRVTSAKPSGPAKPANRPARVIQARPIIPNKLFYRIQEAAELTGLKPSVLRYWETEFRELRPEKDASDQRRYRQADLEVVLAIRKLLYEDRYTIKGARSRLREELRRLRQEAAAKAAAPATPATVVETVRAPEPAAAKAVTTAVETKTACALDADRKHELDQSLTRLRAEVNALLDMLS